MEKITYAKLRKIMETHNVRFPEHSDKPVLHGVIVYRADNWTEDYSLEARSYRVSNNNRAFQPGKIARSLFGNSLDGTDQGVRLDWYNWRVDYCYML